MTEIYEYFNWDSLSLYFHPHFNFPADSFPVLFSSETYLTEPSQDLTDVN